MALRRRLGPDLALLFAATGGAVAWTIQLWLGWLIDDLGCRLQPGELVIGGLGTGALWVVIGVGTGLLALAASWVSWRLTGAGQGRADGPRRFLATAALALNLLLIGTIVLGTTSPLLVPPCA